MKRLGVIAVVAILGLSACTGSGASRASSRLQNAQQSQTVAAFSHQVAAVPYPSSQLNDSLERRNLRERLLRLNKPDKIGYVYLLSNNGSVITFYTIKGKVSSTDSQMSAVELNVHCNGSSDNGSYCTVHAPGDDGSYGANEPGIFFFTTEGVMVQWNGPYLYADAPLKVTSAPVLVYDTNSKPSSTAGG